MNMFDPQPACHVITGQNSAGNTTFMLQYTLIVEQTFLSAHFAQTGMSAPRIFGNPNSGAEQISSPADC